MTNALTSNTNEREPNEASRARSLLLALPQELIHQVAAQLPEAKSIRLACSELRIAYGPIGQRLTVGEPEHCAKMFAARPMSAILKQPLFTWPYPDAVRHLRLQMDAPLPAAVCKAIALTFPNLKLLEAEPPAYQDLAALPAGLTQLRVVQSWLPAASLQHLGPSLRALELGHLESVSGPWPVGALPCLTRLLVASSPVMLTHAVRRDGTQSVVLVEMLRMMPALRSLTINSFHMYYATIEEFRLVNEELQHHPLDSICLILTDAPAWDAIVRPRITRIMSGLPHLRDIRLGMDDVRASACIVGPHSATTAPCTTAPGANWVCRVGLPGYPVEKSASHTYQQGVFLLELLWGRVPQCPVVEVSYRNGECDAETVAVGGFICPLFTRLAAANAHGLAEMHLLGFGVVRRLARMVPLLAALTRLVLERWEADDVLLAALGTQPVSTQLRYLGLGQQYGGEGQAWEGLARCLEAVRNLEGLTELYLGEVGAPGGGVLGPEAAMRELVPLPARLRMVAVQRGNQEVMDAVRSVCGQRVGEVVWGDALQVPHPAGLRWCGGDEGQEQAGGAAAPGLWPCSTRT